MRRLLVVLVLAGCVHSTSSSPAWPKDRTDGEGGESLAPREATQSVEVALENGDGDDKPAEEAAETPADDAAPATEGSAAAADSPAASDEPITTEEIVIEVGGDD